MGVSPENTLSFKNEAHLGVDKLFLQAMAFLKVQASLENLGKFPDVLTF